jgi:hypothetical protein
MALLDMQGMETRSPGWHHSDGHGGGSAFSLALCNSHASVTLCL